MNQGYRIASEILSLPEARDLVLTDERLQKLRSSSRRVNEVFILGAQDSAMTDFIGQVLQVSSVLPGHSHSWPAMLRLVYAPEPTVRVELRTGSELKTLADKLGIGFAEERFPERPKMSLSLSELCETLDVTQPAGIWIREAEIGVPNRFLQQAHLRILPSLLLEMEGLRVRESLYACNAGVFCIPAKRVLSQPDLQAAEESLALFPAHRKLLVITGMQFSQKPENVREWVHALSYGPSFRDHALFQTQRAPVFFGGGEQELLQVREFLHSLFRQGWRDTLCLRLAIRYCEEALHQIDARIMQFKRELQVDAEALQQIRTRLQVGQEAFEETRVALQEFGTKLDESLKVALKQMKSRMQPRYQELLEWIEQRVSQVQTWQGLTIETPWILKYALEHHRETLFNEHLSILESLGEECKTQLIALKNPDLSEKCEPILVEAFEWVRMELDEWWDSGLSLQHFRASKVSAFKRVLALFSATQFAQQKQKLINSIRDEALHAFEECRILVEDCLQEALEKLWKEVSTEVFRAQSTLDTELKSLQGQFNSAAGKEKSLESKLLRNQEIRQTWWEYLKDLRAMTKDFSE